ncbi:tetratricopeptide repeat protein [Aromatoleum tolulyticum]|nr:tetratricopeptide repeat protein [Aromatoleum tolulyticum]
MNGRLWGAGGALTSSRVLLLLLYVIIAFVLVSLFARPGYLDFVTPNHSDLYRYYLIAHERWSSADFLSPRPVMLAYLRLAGIFDAENALAVLLVVPSLVFIALTILLVERIIGHRFPLWAIGIYMFIVVGSPLYFPIAQYDFGGMLAGALSVVAVLMWLNQIEVEGGRVRLSQLVFPIVIFWLSVEAKPTYGVSIAGMAFVFDLLSRGRKGRWLTTGAVVSVIALVFIKDAVLGSKFLRLDTASDAYTLAVSPRRNIELLLFYLVSGIGVPVMVAATIASTSFIAGRHWKFILYAIACAVGATIPMALLVNREWDIYGWYSLVPVALIVVVGVIKFSEIGLNSRKLSVSGAARIAGLAGIITAVAIHAFSFAASTEWSVENQRYGKAVLSSLRLLHSQQGQKVLIAGVRGPYHPFRNTRYVLTRFPEVGKFDLILRRSERGWNNMSKELVNGVYADEAAVGGYDKVYVFGKSGSLEQVTDGPRLQEMLPAERILLLVCGITWRSIDDVVVVGRALECANEAAEYQATVSLAEDAVRRHLLSSWIYLHYGAALAEMGRLSEAQQYIKMGLDLEPNNPALAALKRNVEQR